MNTDLAQRGYLLVAEQCRKHKFGIDFMRQVQNIRVDNHGTNGQNFTSNALISI